MEWKHYSTRMVKRTYQSTIHACWLAGGIQALVCIYVPLLFLHFREEFGISLGELGSLVVVNFGTQLVVDILAARYAERIGVRFCMVLSNVVMAAGLASLTFLPQVVPAFWGLAASVVLYAIGGGLVEVLTSPTVEACPTENKASQMAFLHSIYSIGSIVIIVVSTLFFRLFGLANWRILTLLWTLFPLYNMVNFMLVPMPRLVPEGEKGLSFGELFRMPLFWLLLLIMTCSGAAEQAMAQWASAFAEAGLRVSKPVGDLFGACFFAILMCLARLLSSRYADRVDLNGAMIKSALICIAGYLLAIFAPWPLLGLAGVGVTGFGVGVMWPGTLSLGARKIPGGGAALFGLCALGGDLGCSTGPGLVGWLASASGDNLKAGLVVGLVYSVILCMGLSVLRRLRKKG